MAGIAKQRQRLAMCVAPCDLVAANVARTGREGDPQRPAIPLAARQLHIGSFDRDFLVGLKSGQAEGENVRRFAALVSAAWWPSFLARS